MADLLDRMLRRVAALAPDVSHDALARVEVEIRAELGGCDGGYIAKRPTLQKAVRFAESLRGGASVVAVVREAPCHRATAYRILSRPLKARR